MRKGKNNQKKDVKLMTNKRNFESKNRNVKEKRN